MRLKNASWKSLYSAGLSVISRVENGCTMLKDRDIREPLFAFLEESYGRIRIIEEKNMGGSRADVIMVTPDSFVGIEIKSDADTYTRLAGQVEDYDRYFDMNIIVVGTRHAMHVEEHVPASWGIITVEEVEERADFYVLRRPKPNPGIDPARKLSLLWRPELQHIVYRHLKHKYDRISKKDVIAKILAGVPYETLRLEMSEELFERDYTRIFDEINRFRVEHEGKKPRRRRRQLHAKLHPANASAATSSLPPEACGDGKPKRAGATRTANASVAASSPSPEVSDDEKTKRAGATHTARRRKPNLHVKHVVKGRKSPKTGKKST